MLSSPPRQRALATRIRAAMSTRQMLRAAGDDCIEQKYLSPRLKQPASVWSRRLIGIENSTAIENRSSSLVYPPWRMEIQHPL